MSTFQLEFWGVRGSIACPSPRHVVYGGNTSCLELIAGEQRVILDAGTGLRSLGNAFLKAGAKKARLLLTHTHWDHINGWPFFKPGFVPANTFEIMAGHLPGEGLREVFEGQMAQPMFPVPLTTMQANLTFQSFNAGEVLSLGDGVVVKTAPLNHPNGATGYRVEYGGKALCYVTDTEHIPGKPDERVLALIEGADLVVYDSTYTDDEFTKHIGWGHSTWQEAIRLCRMANVKQLAIFHHDPDHEDEFMAQVEVDARQIWSGALVARERMQLKIG